MKKKFIKYFVDKFWNCETFQEEIAERIKNQYVKWAFERFGKCITKVDGYDVIHNADEVVPSFYKYNVTEDKVSDTKITHIEVNGITYPIAELKDTKVETKKPKRKYNRKKKDGSSNKENS